MTHKKIALALLTLAAIFAAAFLLRTQEEAAQPAELQGTTALFFRSDPGQLEAAESAVDCAKPEQARKKVTDGAVHFWRDEDDEEKAGTFIQFESRSRVLTVCDRGRRVSGILPVDEQVKDIELVRLTEAQYGDMNGDGKNEFFVFQGQCAEGPCLGGYYLFQVDGDKIRRLQTINAEVVKAITENGRRALRMEKHCFTYDFGMGPSYFSVAEFQEDGSLRTVPYQELRSKYPEATAELQPTQEFDVDYELPAEQKAYLKIHDLIVDAYRGKPLGELLKAHDAVLADLLPAEGETSPSARLNLYCDTREILELISGN